MFRPTRLAAAALLLVCSAAGFVVPLAALADPRPAEPMDAARMIVALRRLQNAGSVLYVGAHPDDENTAMLCWLTRGRGVRAAYLSLTRGDGGQNLIGTETGDALGVLRTQELLAARRIDGAGQFFTRAIDFGFSKSPDEALSVWGHDLILSDVVRVIRTFRPDVIVTRFGTDGSGGHGHHTASAILAGEAFRAAADSTRFPELGLRPWQAKRIVWNVFQPKLDGRDPQRPPPLTVDVGGYEPLLARSYSEIAGLSRSMHKSQGFGAPERRGSIVQYLDHVDGDPAKADLLDGVDLSWARVRGGEKVGTLLAAAEKAFDPRHPAVILPLLVKAEAAARALPTGSQEPWVHARRAELREVIRSCAGLWIEAIAAQPSVTPGGTVSIRVSVLQRSDAALELRGIGLMSFGAGLARTETRLGAGAGADSGASATQVHVRLRPNAAVTADASVSIDAEAPITQPYWLTAPAVGGAFTVSNPGLIGLAEDPPALRIQVAVAIADDVVTYEIPVVTRAVDPVEGERYRALEIAPPVTFRFDRGAYLFPNRAPRDVRVTVDRADSNASGRVALVAPDGWSVEPVEAEPRFAPGAVTTTLTFRVTPAGAAPSGALTAAFRTADRVWSNKLQRIDHPHVPIQTLFPPAQARLVRADVRSATGPLGYVMGSGDAVPEALAQLGFDVTLLADEDVESGNLSRFTAIVVGVRAFNTRPRVLAASARLLDYASGGGRLVLQYQTPDAALVDRLGPYPFTVSRDRVSVETAEMRVLRPDHPLLRAPNRIEPADWNGWVQERGLAYANPFDPRYQTILAANDPGEPSREGGLLYADVGRGSFVYTGLALFRQLPAGVPGAYRLLANLVSPAPKP